MDAFGTSILVLVLHGQLLTKNTGYLRLTKMLKEIARIIRYYRIWGGMYSLSGSVNSRKTG